MAFEDDLAAAKAAPPKYEIVPVVLDANVSEELEQLKAQLEDVESDQRMSADPGAELRERIAKLEASATLHYLKFTRVPGDKWAELTARHLARPGVLLDLRYGYNIGAVIKEAAPISGVRLDGDVEEPLTPEQWADLFVILSGYEVQRITDAIYGLNEYDPEQAVQKLKKASTSTPDSDQRLS